MPFDHTQLDTGVLTRHQLMFGRELEAAMALQGWQNFTAIPPTLTSGDRAKYHGLGEVPRSQNIDHAPLQSHGLSKFDHTIETHEMATSIEIELKAEEDDGLDLISPKIPQLAMSQEYDIGLTVLEQLNGNPTAYDGVALFSSSRVIGDSGTIDNDLSGSAGGTPTAPTVAAVQAALSAARGKFAAWKDEHGRVRNRRPNAMLIPAGMETVVFQALAGSAFPGVTSPVVPAATRGIWQAGSYTIFTNPASDNGAEIFFVDTSGMGPLEKPLVMQMRLQPQLWQSAPFQSDTTKWVRKLAVRGRWGAGVGEPKTIARYTFT